MNTAKLIKKIVFSTLFVVEVAVLTLPVQTLAATAPASKTTSRLPAARTVIPSSKAQKSSSVKKIKTPVKPVPASPAPLTVFSPNGSLLRPHAPATPAILGENIKKYAQTIVNDKPIVLSGFDVMEIKNTHYIQNGNITLKDSAKLIITNSYFEQRNTAGMAPRLEAKNYSQVVIKNSEASFSPWIVWNFTDKTQLFIDALKVTENPGDANVYYEITGDTKAEIRKALFTASVTDQADVTIDKSARVVLNLALSGGAIVNEQFPKNITDYSFPGYDDRNVALKLKITNAVAPEWGVTIYPTSNVTIRDTEGLTIGFSVISPWVGATATFENLRPGYYADDKFGFSQTTAQFWDRNMKIHLVKTTVKAWSPMVGDDNTLILKNSEIAELPWSWGNAKIILENSTTTFIRARQSVEITAKNSAINGDITAIEDGKINLIHTRVLGKKIIQGKGQIVE
ncbi:MAG: hypothetical protein HY983_01275 [Candidatus Magasanikbacteria bacterium]|nr:hypothetical protein [Candidatus Magasanikbacteria bacterium]